MKLSNRLKWTVITLGYVLMILLLSFRHPGTGSYSLIREIMNNFAHVPLYGGLAYFLLIALKHIRIRSAYFYTIAVGMSVAVIDEFFQSFVPGRSVDPMDLMLDFMGICLSIAVFNVLRTKNKKQNKCVEIGETGEIL